MTERFEDNCSPIDLCGFNGGENFGWNVYQPGYNSTIPALGLAWSHCVNTRIMLFKGSGAQTRTLVDAPEATENGNGQSVPPSQNPSADASSPRDAAPIFPTVPNTSDLSLCCDSGRHLRLLAAPQGLSVAFGV